MKIFRLASPLAEDDAFAIAARPGTWTKGKGLCPECWSARQHRKSPLLLEWMPSRSHVVGDFLWPGFGGEAGLTDRAVAVLRGARVGGFSLGAVKHLPAKTRLESAEVQGRRRPRFPNGGPRLRELRIIREVAFDNQRSSVTEEQPPCSTCGRTFYVLSGVEERFRAGTVRRRRGKGLYVRKRSLRGDGLFKVRGFGECLLCTEDVRDLVREAGLTNVDFLEFGETF